MDSSFGAEPLVDAFLVLGAASVQTIKTLDPIDGETLKYEPQILDCFPSSKRKWNILDTFASFACDGLEIFEKEGPISTLTLMLSSETGKRKYCQLLYFTDRLPHSSPQDEEELLKASSAPSSSSASSSSEKTKKSQSQSSDEDEEAVDEDQGDSEPDSDHNENHQDETPPSSGPESPVELRKDIHLRRSGSVGRQRPSSPLALEQPSSRARFTLETPSFLTSEEDQALLIPDEGDEKEKGNSSIPPSLSMSDVPMLAEKSTSFLTDLPLSLKGKKGRERAKSISTDQGISKSFTSPRKKKGISGRLQHLRPFKRESSIGTIEKSALLGKALIERKMKQSDSSMPDIYLTKVICIISSYPYLQLFENMLKDLYFSCKAESFFTLERFVSQMILEIPAPTPDSCVFYRFHSPFQTLTISHPSPFELPAFDFPISTLFMCLDVKNVIKLMMAVFFDRKVLLLSRHKQHISHVALAILTLMHPFEYFHTCIPNLPTKLIEMVESPSPFFVGLNITSSKPMRDIEELLIIELDRNKIVEASHKPPALPKLPNSPKNRLIEELRFHTNPDAFCRMNVSPQEAQYVTSESKIEYHTKQIQLAFARFFASIFCEYRRFMPNENRPFDFDGLANSCSPDTSDFIKGLESSQSFIQFVDSRIDAKYPGDLFDLLCEKEMADRKSANGEPAEHLLLPSSVPDPIPEREIYSLTPHALNQKIVAFVRQHHSIAINIPQPLSEGDIAVREPIEIFPELLTSGTICQENPYIIPRITYTFTPLIARFDALIEAIDDTIQVNSNLAIDDTCIIEKTEIHLQILKAHYFVSWSNIVNDKTLQICKLVQALSCLNAVSLLAIEQPPSSTPSISTSESPSIRSPLLSPQSSNSNLAASLALSTSSQTQTKDLAHLGLRACSLEKHVDRILEYLSDDDINYIIKTGNLNFSFFPTFLSANTFTSSSSSSSSSSAPPSLLGLTSPLSSSLPSISFDPFPSLAGDPRKVSSWLMHRLTLVLSRRKKADRDLKISVQSVDDSADDPNDLVISGPSCKNDRVLLMRQLCEDCSEMNVTQFMKLLRQMRVIEEESASLKLEEILHYEYSTNMSPQLFLMLIKSFESLAQRWALRLSPQVRPFLNNETLLWTSKVSNIGGRQYDAFLTQTRILFHRKDGEVKFIKLEDVISVTKCNYKIVIPPGLPCVRMRMRGQDKPHLIILWASQQRNLLVRYMQEIVSAFRMGFDLFDPSIPKMAEQNILMSGALLNLPFLRRKALDVLTFGCFEKSTWSSICRNFTNNLPLNGNEDPFDDEHVADPLELSSSLLDMLRGIFYASVDTSVSRRKVRDRKDVVRSAEFAEFTRRSRLLMSVDLFQMDPTKLTLFFVNIFNLMIIHAYVLCNFPTSIWDWRYIEQSASYSIGGRLFTLKDVLHGILRRYKLSPWYHQPPFSEKDAKMQISEKIICDQRVHFLLSWHLKYSPFMYQTNTESIEKLLEYAAGNFCSAFVHVKAESSTICLPKLFDWFKEDFGRGTKDMLLWIKKYLNQQQARDLQTILDNGSYNIKWKWNWTIVPKPRFSFDG